MENNQNEFVTVCQFTAFTTQLFDRLAQMQESINEFRENGSGSLTEDKNVSSPNVDVLHHNTPAGVSSTKATEKKSKALIYYELEVSRSKKWMSSVVDEFTKDLQNRERFWTAFEGLLPDWSRIMYVKILYVGFGITQLSCVLGICSDPTRTMCCLY